MVMFSPERRLIYKFSVTHGDFRRVGEETSRFKRSLLSIGFPSGASRRALVAAYELILNVIIHARQGSLEAHWHEGALEITVEDEGPGIDDIEMAMKDGYSTAPSYVREMGYGAGMGLPNAKKSSDDMTVDSQVGKGTRIVCTITPGKQDLEAGSYFHSVRLDPSKCKGCTSCMKGCPTEAIRVRGGKAFILEDRCIDCGECIRRCPNQAKYTVTDSLEILDELEYKIALVPPSFYGQFEDATPTKIRKALCAPCGFDEIFDVAVAADLVSMAIRSYVKGQDRYKPVISSSCPAVIRLIQVKYPSLLKHVVHCEAPMEVAALLAKEKAAANMPGKNISAVYISPCPAKTTAARQPVGRGRSLVDHVVSQSHVYLWVLDRLERVSHEEDVSTSTGLGIGWGRSGGELMAVGAKGLAVDGIAQVSSVLDQIEKGKLKSVDYIEALACTGGCVGGCLAVENPFVARMRIRELAVKHRKAPMNLAVKAHCQDEPGLWFSLALQPRPIFKLDNDPQKAEEKLARLKEIHAGLPGLDCGACGAPTCRALAEDIVLGRGSIWDCVFKLRKRLEIMAQEVKDLAGKPPSSMVSSIDEGSEKGSI